MIVNLSGVHRTASADELQHALDVPAARDAPRHVTPAARMHQVEHVVGHEAVVDEEVLMDVQAGVPALQITCAVVRHTVPQRQILRACRRSNRVSLHETECLERLRQGSRWKEAPRDRESAQFVDGQRWQEDVLNESCLGFCPLHESGRLTART
jgi:hypothetical protein